ncbi:LacI family DNA-binding transcriptional regulator [Acidisarcina polymorpha]|uniref:LacI family DNA-binding transcriptional regulator n=1 Tax=Acidisarcina polymorpha TaxID=2211140 RepID=UPI000DEF20F8|nr:LacI family DNA-binding transcriptional regulator [Acidisarcina polymorpha]
MKRKTKTALVKLDIRAVAERARVSIATVSRTVNGIPSVGPDLAKRVWKAIEELDYYPNTQARGLVSGRSRLLGLVISEITNPFFPELIQGFEEIAVENGYEILIGSTNYDPKRMNLVIRRMLERKVEGVAVMTFGIEEPLLQQLAERRIPLTLIDFDLPSPLVSTLRVDYGAGIGQAVHHLAALGHRQITFISGSATLHSARARVDAFKIAAKEARFSPKDARIVEANHTIEGGMLAFERLQARGELATAIMCSNDMTAIGVLRSAFSIGLRVPRDLSIIGFDDIRFAQFTTPPLTTVQMSRVDLARTAFFALRDHGEIPLKATTPREYTIPTKLVVRQSTDVPRDSLKRN